MNTDDGNSNGGGNGAGNGPGGSSGNGPKRAPSVTLLHMCAQALAEPISDRWQYSYAKSLINKFV